MKLTSELIESQAWYLSWDPSTACFARDPSTTCFACGPIYIYIYIVEFDRGIFFGILVRLALLVVPDLEHNMETALDEGYYDLNSSTTVTTQTSRSSRTLRFREPSKSTDSRNKQKEKEEQNNQILL
ncbi:unnamed protein product [Rhizophagus irregularis]|nr:unnamed protein product [Rhizophagus irregularis]